MLVPADIFNTYELKLLEAKLYRTHLYVKGPGVTWEDVGCPPRAVKCKIHQFSGGVVCVTYKNTKGTWLGQAVPISQCSIVYNMEDILRTLEARAKEI